MQESLRIKYRHMRKRKHTSKDWRLLACDSKILAGGRTVLFQLCGTTSPSREMAHLLAQTDLLFFCCGTMVNKQSKVSKLKFTLANARHCGNQKFFVKFSEPSDKYQNKVFKLLIISPSKHMCYMYADEFAVVSKNPGWSSDLPRAIGGEKIKKRERLFHNHLRFACQKIVRLTTVNPFFFVAQAQRQSQRWWKKWLPQLVNCTRYANLSIFSITRIKQKQMFQQVRALTRVTSTFTNDDKWTKEKAKVICFQNI